MLPHQKNKIDVSTLTEEEQKLFRLYGKLPAKKDILQNKLKERKYFDSGDYALSKAGKASDAGVTTIGSRHPQPENIPHLSSPVTGHLPFGGTAQVPPTGGAAGSPVKESSFLQRETSIDESENAAKEESTEKLPIKELPKEQSISPPPVTQVQKGVPLRWQ